MVAAQSVSHWIAHLKDGNALAAQQLWDRYASRLVEYAHRRMKDSPKRVADEEDVAASVFQALCRGAAEGRFQNVKNRDDLWWILLAITKQKVVSHIRRETTQKRGAGWVRLQPVSNSDTDDGSGFTLDHLISNTPTPEFLVSLEEQHHRLLGLLRDDCLRQIAVFRIEGFTVPEIAVDLHLSKRSIERKLQLIRGVWSKELQS